MPCDFTFGGGIRRGGVGGGGGGRGGGRLVDEEEGVGGQGRDGGGPGVRVARLLLEEVLDVVGADVGAPRLLPSPRPLRGLPHLLRRRWCPAHLAPPPPPPRAHVGEREREREGEGGGGGFGRKALWGVRVSAVRMGTGSLTSGPLG